LSVTWYGSPSVVQSPLQNIYAAKVADLASGNWLRHGLGTVDAVSRRQPHQRRIRSDI